MSPATAGIGPPRQSVCQPVSKASHLTRAAIILADMGAGSGQVASDWFDAMYEDVAATGARFTAVGIVTPDPASVESVLAWANRLQERAQYLIVQNATSPQADFSYWESARASHSFPRSAIADRDSDGISAGRT